jgi:predicted enzyme related to lactoylglutathione lyase
VHPDIHSITIDTTGDPYDVARFWSELLGRPMDDDDKPGDPAALVHSGGGVPRLLFQRVPDVKSVKNRLHLDLVPRGRTRDEEVTRVVGLGATVVDDQRRPDGTGWVVLADPEGNEFCVERSAAERGEQ